jgi:hypothetical protein
MKMTLEQIEKFISIRNESEFDSNLQFAIDANEAGLNLDELGPGKKIDIKHYEWQTEFGRLIESGGILRLER